MTVRGEVRHTEGSGSDLLYCAFYSDYFPRGTTTTRGQSEQTYCSRDLNIVPPKHETERCPYTMSQTKGIDQYLKFWAGFLRLYKCA